MSDEKTTALQAVTVAAQEAERTREAARQAQVVYVEAIQHALNLASGDEVALAAGKASRAGLYQALRQRGVRRGQRRIKPIPIDE